MLILLSLACIGGLIWNYATGTVTPLKGQSTLLHRIALWNSTTEKYAPCKLWNSQYMRELRTPKNEIVPPFRRPMINIDPEVLHAGIAHPQNVILSKKVQRICSGKVKVTFSFDSVKEILMCCLRECRNQNKILVHCCQVSSTELKLKWSIEKSENM